jgi:L-threonylcarbamoyladenylate synthase
MEIISNPTQDEIKKAAKALKDGHLVAFPTETVYGLGADATNEKAVSRIYSVKGRPSDHPLIVHISSINQLDKWAVDIPNYAIKLAKEFWPGPLTLILKRSNLAKNFITGGQDNVGVRVPAQPLALTLLNEFDEIGGLGVAAPSANRFGAVSPTTTDAVAEELGNFFNQEDLILSGGQCQIGIESTIIDCTKDAPYILRPGVITSEMIENVILRKVIFKRVGSDVRASGLLDSHYSPKAKVELNTVTKPGDGFIAMKEIPTPFGVVRLGSPKNIEEYARGLYEALRMGDQKLLSKIVIILPEGEGVATAVRDRLLKAAAG